MGSEAIEIQAEPFSYVGLSQNNFLISSGTVNESGFLVLVFEAINNPGILDIIITGQNKIPYFGEIFVASPDGAYVTINSDIINVGDDGIISLGETITLELEIENLGTEVASNIQLELSNPYNDSYINLTDSEISITNLNIGEIVSVNLAFYIEQSSPYGHNFTLIASMNSEESSWESTYNLDVEPLLEDFDSASFEEFLWEFSGDSNWTIDGNQFIGDSYSAKSGTIDHNMTSELFIAMEIVEDGQVRFDKRVSCEDVGLYTGNYYDYLAFYIDGVEQAKWAGEIDWSQNSFSVSSGEHTFLWQYNKDQGASSGNDAVWIDNIVFPPSYYSSVLYGDVNDDGNINIQDVILTVNIILDSLTYNDAADLNTDGVVDVLDVINIVNLILN